MSEIKDKCVEFSESEKGLSSVINEYIKEGPCLKISYQKTGTDIRANARRNSKRFKPFLRMLLFAIVTLSWSLFFMFIEFQKKATDFYFFGIMINCFFLGVWTGLILMILWVFICFIIWKKKLDGISDVSVDLCFFKDCVLIATSNFMSLVVYSSKNNEIVEYNEEFIVSYKEHPQAGRVSFSVSKRYLIDDEIDKIRECAKKF